MTRIRKPSTQVGYVLAVVIGMTLVGIPLAVLSFDWGNMWAVLALVGAVVVAARTFRGSRESDAPRPWWRMTSSRGASLVVSVFFFLPGLYNVSIGASGSPNPPLVVAGGVAFLVVAGLALNSAARISRR